jgi:hypothetical protein
LSLAHGTDDVAHTDTPVAAGPSHVLPTLRDAMCAKRTLARWRLCSDRPYIRASGSDASVRAQSGAPPSPTCRPDRKPHPRRPSRALRAARGHSAGGVPRRRDERAHSVALRDDALCPTVQPDDDNRGRGSARGRKRKWKRVRGERRPELTDHALSARWQSTVLADGRPIWHPPARAAREKPASKPCV